MTSRTKEVAKFFAGVAAEETVVHWTLGFSEVLPLKLFGITITPTLNTGAMVVWPIIAGLLVYYAWMQKEHPLSA